MERTPLVEFTALGSRSGPAARRSQEGTPGRHAAVFGELRRGQVVLAVTEDGICLLGRINRMPRAELTR